MEKMSFRRLVHTVKTCTVSGTDPHMGLCVPYSDTEKKHQKETQPLTATATDE